MKTVDKLFTNAFVLTMDNRFRHFETGSVAVQGNLIIDVGTDARLIEEYSANEVINCQGKVLMPGLINGHTHAPMTLLRGLADDLRLDVWLMGFMMPVEREFVTPEFVRLGTSLACAEMIRSGVTTFCDMYYFEDDVAKATAEAGMRAVCGESILKFPTPDSQSFDESLAYAREFISRWKDHPLIVPAVAPHAPYTCTEEILRASSSLAVEFDVPLVIHIAETGSEVENLRKETGMPVIPYIKKFNLFEAKVIAAHCVHIDEGEIRTLVHAGAGVVHNPSSNLKLASGMAPVKKMLELNIKLGIGTDGPASNNDLDMFEEIRLAAFLAKGSSGDPTAFPARMAILAATRMGAAALHIDHLTGSIEPGKRADLIMVDLRTLHNAPYFRRDPNSIYAQLVYASKATDVTDVMIDGHFVLRNKNLMTLNETELFEYSQEYARKIDIFLIEREQSVLSKLIAIGGASEEESFEVQAKVPIKEIGPVLEKINSSGISMLRKRHYREYDTYFTFFDPKQGRIRFREDHFIDENNATTHVRSRLTHIGVAREAELPQSVLLSRSRYLAPATQSLRFYREYFKPDKEEDIEKDRLRFLISYQGHEFFINLDTLFKPGLGSFLEVKSRTWSRKDAELKAKIAIELVEFLGIPAGKAILEDYIELIQN